MITLLNNEVWGVDEILVQMVQDEFYYGHLGKHALSSSSLKLILKSPKTYRNVLKYGQAESKALTDGKLLHWLVLEPHKMDDLKIVDATTKNTKVYKEAKAQYGEVYLRKEVDGAERLADAVLRNEAALELLTNAEFEVPAIAMLEDLPIRGKADILKGDMLIDLKSSQDCSSFQYSADKFSYDLQAWLYLQLFPQAKSFTFLVIDKNSCDIGIFETSEEFLEGGRQKFLKAVERYKYFFEQGNDLDQYVLRATL